MNKKEIQLSKEFKSQATKAIFAISVFIVTYLIMLLLAILLTGLCIVGGMSLIAIKPMFITIVLGIGLASVGVLILIFILKFIFKSHKIDRSHLIEIDEYQEPELFKMIEEIVQQVGTSFPKKVYLSSDVNASVFYDSSFWSMILPVKKNLQIGLGLINTTTKQELKAILSHEFGHFSQRTMKVGSYVYNLNQVIFNMLYDNESYERLIQRWSDVSGYFSIFVLIAVRINEGIQWVLRKLYGVVNRNYLGLSREMEFHADEIAASVTGYEPLKTSLLRMNLADNSFNNVLSFYDGKISEKIKSENVYKDQTEVIYCLSELQGLTITNGLPDISLEEQSKFDKSKLVIKDQWASHPTTYDRIKRLEETGFSNKIDSDTLANEIFRGLADLQEKFTKKIFENVDYQGEAVSISSLKFVEQYRQEIFSNSFDRMYNGYYDYKNPISFDLNANGSRVNKDSMEQLFSDEKVDWVYSSISLQGDIETLRNISDNLLSIKTFDYDGIKYKKTDAQGLVEKLKVELENVNEKIKMNDVGIYHYFETIEEKQSRQKELKSIYEALFTFDKNFDSKYDVYIKLLNELQFLNVTTTFEQIKANLTAIQPKEEVLKQEIKALLSDNVLTSEITPEVKDNLEKYVSKVWEYFDGTSYNDNNLSIFHRALHNYSFLLSRKYFLMKKALLNYQKELI